MNTPPKITAAVSNMTSKEIAAWALEHLDGAKLDPKWGKSIMLKKAQNIIEAMKTAAKAGVAKAETTKPDVHEAIHKPAKPEHPKTELQAKLEAKGFSKELVKPAKTKKEGSRTSGSKDRDDAGFLVDSKRGIAFQMLKDGCTVEQLKEKVGKGKGIIDWFKKLEAVEADIVEKNGIFKIKSYKSKE